VQPSHFCSSSSLIDSPTIHIKLWVLICYAVKLEALLPYSKCLAPAFPTKRSQYLNLSRSSVQSRRPTSKPELPQSSFSMFPLTTGGEHIQKGLPGPAPFVVLGNPTATVTSTTCTPATTAPVACNTDNCLRTLQYNPVPASSFCSSNLIVKITSTPSFISHGCASSPVRISSACKCLAAEKAKRTFVREVRKPVLEKDDLEERDTGYSGPDETFSVAPPAAHKITTILTKVWIKSYGSAH
jgi:hypothetical protein